MINGTFTEKQEKNNKLSGKGGKMEAYKGDITSGAYYYFLFVALYGFLYFPGLAAWGGWGLSGLVASSIAVKVLAAIFGGIIGLVIWYAFALVIPHRFRKFGADYQATCEAISKSEQNYNW